MRPMPPPSPAGAPQRLNRTTGNGRLELVWYGGGEPEGELFEALVAAGLERRGQRDGGLEVHTAEGSAWVKGGRLTGKSALRHGLRRLVLGRAFPRLREAENLSWLAAHGITAARPLLAGLHHGRGPLPGAQFLATELIAGAVPLDQLARRDPAAYATARDRATELLAAMHAAGFEHRDAFERNFLVTGAPASPIVTAIDTWRGGPHRRLGPRAMARDRGQLGSSS